MGALRNSPNAVTATVSPEVGIDSLSAIACSRVLGMLLYLERQAV